MYVFLENKNIFKEPKWAALKHGIRNPETETETEAETEYGIKYQW